MLCGGRHTLGKDPQGTPLEHHTVPLALAERVNGLGPMNTWGRSRAMDFFEDYTTLGLVGEL
jgi:hypothetical protein